MGHTDDLLLGLAQVADGAGLGIYSETVPYAVDQTGIGIGKLPNGCHRAIAFTDYNTDDAQPGLAQTTIYVQALFRGDPDDRKSMTDLRDAGYNLLQNLTDRQFGTAHLDQCFRKGTVPLGMDEQNRWVQADNYQLDLSLTPSATRT